MQNKQIKVSLTIFLDFLLKSGEDKQKCVDNFKNKPYSTGQDYYKLVRNAIKTAKNRKDFENKDFESNSNKLKNFQDMKNGYLKFLGKNEFDNKKITTTLAPLGDVKNGEYVTVKINPELCVNFKNETYIIKLYFNKDSKLTLKTSKLITNLMFISLKEKYPNAKYAVLDVKRGKLFEYSPSNTDLSNLLHNEAKSFYNLY